MPPRSFRNDSFFLAIERSGVADEVMATAILYRLLHRCHVLAIKGRSYRLKELEKLLK